MSLEKTQPHRARESGRVLAVALCGGDGLQWETDFEADDAVDGLGDFRRLRTVSGTAGPRGKQ
jgi:hypothetical protein